MMTSFPRSESLSIAPQVRCQYSMIWPPPLLPRKSLRRAKRLKNQVVKLQKRHQARKNLEVSTHSSNVRLLIHTTLAFANVTSGLGTGIREDATSGSSSQLLGSTTATSDPQPAMAMSARCGN